MTRLKTYSLVAMAVLLTGCGIQTGIQGEGNTQDKRLVTVEDLKPVVAAIADVNEQTNDMRANFRDVKQAVAVTGNQTNGVSGERLALYFFLYFIGSKVFDSFRDWRNRKRVRKPGWAPPG